MEDIVVENRQSGLHCLVSGRVQGVCFRAETESQASRRGLTGWVRNLPDGRVEIQAFGPEPALDELRTWLKKGPPQAHVLKLDCEPVAYQEYSGFRVERTPAGIGSA